MTQDPHATDDAEDEGIEPEHTGPDLADLSKEEHADLAEELKAMDAEHTQEMGH